MDGHRFKRHRIEGPLGLDPLDLIREDAERLGCTCGDRLQITVKEVEPEPGVARTRAADVRHDMRCPVIAAEIAGSAHLN